MASSTSCVHDIELPVLSRCTERLSSTFTSQDQATDKIPAPGLSISGVEGSSSAQVETPTQRKTSEVSDEGIAFPGATISTPVHTELVNDGSTRGEPPIPNYSAIDLSTLSYPSITHAPFIPTSLPSTTSQLNSASRPDSLHTPDPHAPNVDADTFNLLRYNELHGHGGAPVNRPPEAVHISRHRNRETDADGLSFATDIESLPAYGENIPPRYTRRIENSQDEPQTLAMLFFKFGFFFPAFWVFGALILVTPLRSPNPLSPEALASAWPPNTELIAWVNQNIRTEEDKEAFLTKMHEVEIKWAKRCLLAIVLLVSFSAAIGLTIFGVLKGTTRMP